MSSLTFKQQYFVPIAVYSAITVALSISLAGTSDTVARKTLGSTSPSPSVAPVLTPATPAPEEAMPTSESDQAAETQSNDQSNEQAAYISETTSAPLADQTNNPQPAGALAVPPTPHALVSTANPLSPFIPNFTNPEAKPNAFNQTETDATIDQLIVAQNRDDVSVVRDSQQLLEQTPKPLSGDHGDSERLNKLGLKDLKKKNYVSAIGFFSNASKDDPSDPKLLSNLGFAELNSGQLDTAEKHLKASIALGPGRAVAWDDLGLVYAKKGRTDDAVSCLLHGYDVSGGKTFGFLKSLTSDDDASFQSVGARALEKLQNNNR